MIEPDRLLPNTILRPFQLRWRSLRPHFVVATVCFAISSNATGSDSFTPLRNEYESTIHPLLKQYCFTCHSNENQKGDLNLESFSSMAKVRQRPRAWQKVLFMLDNDEMPPEDGDPLSSQQRKLLRQWIQQYLNAEAKANAGDPGRVVVRRLSNVEYNNTIRDLTGINFQPARHFPSIAWRAKGLRTPVNHS